MDYAACNIIYVDRRAGTDRCIKREEAAPPESPNANLDSEIHYVHRNVQTLLGTFSEGRHQNPQRYIQLTMKQSTFVQVVELVSQSCRNCTRLL